jgi:hypothetical protein
MTISNDSLGCFTQVIYFFIRVEIDYNKKHSSLLQVDINNCNKMLQHTVLKGKLLQKRFMILAMALDDL